MRERMRHRRKKERDNISLRMFVEKEIFGFFFLKFNCGWLNCIELL